MMKRTVLFIVLLTLFALPTHKAHASDNTFWSTTIGAAFGGYLGSHIGKGRGNLAATAAGTFIGAGIGNSIGRSMNRTHNYAPPRYSSPHYYAPSRHYQYYTPNYVAPHSIATQPQVIFTHPKQQQPQHYGPPRPVRVERGYMGTKNPHHMHRGRQCREFTQTVRIDGQVKESYGIACLRPDGSWQIQ